MKTGIWAAAWNTTRGGDGRPPKGGIPLSKATARRLAVLALLASVAVGCALLYHIDPRQAGIPEVCPSIRWWALACPGCGATRAAYLLLHGQVGAAFAMNPLLVAALPLLAGWAAAVLVRLWQGRPIPRGPRWLYVAILVILALYTVARNLPGSPLWPGAMVF